MDEQEFNSDNFEKLKIANARLNEELNHFHRDAKSIALSKEIKRILFAEFKIYLFIGSFCVALATIGGYWKIGEMINTSIEKAVDIQVEEFYPIITQLTDKTIDNWFSSQKNIAAFEENLEEFQKRLYNLKIANAPINLFTAINDDKTDEARDFLNLTTEFNVNSRDCTGRTFLIAAADKGNSDIVKELLEKKVEPDSQDNEGRTALIAAVQMGLSPFIQELLKATIDTNKKNNLGKTALMIAAGNGYKDIVKLLVSDESVDPCLMDNENNDALSLARKNISREQDGFEEIANLINNAIKNSECAFSPEEK